MRLTIWGTRGSVPSPGPDTVRYGGNTACCQVEAGDALIILDAGTGIRRLGEELENDGRRLDILLSHLHIDHIQGLGFFLPLFQPGREVHIWGPASTTRGFRPRLSRYLSQPLFPVPIRELPCDLTLHDTPMEAFDISGVNVLPQLVCHPGPTTGFRLTENGRCLTYLPDHEPALGVTNFPGAGDWTSGYGLARDCDLLVHDAQYLDCEYDDRAGWGHSTIDQALAFARLAGVRGLVTFHHDPSHSDDELERATAAAVRGSGNDLPVVIGAEGATFVV